MDKQDGSAEAWLAKFTKQLRVHLPKGKYILTHAPVAPWFSPGKYSSGAYTKVHKTVGDSIDWYNIQFYNQGTEYTTCEGLITASSSAAPKTAILELIKSGIPADKIVLGKPATAADTTTGFVEPATLAKCVAQGAKAGWKGGISAWQVRIGSLCPVEMSIWLTMQTVPPRRLRLDQDSPWFQLLMIFFRFILSF
jgi:chitinase